MIGAGPSTKRKRNQKPKNKKAGEKQPVQSKAKVDPNSKRVCFHCNKVGHWKRNYKAYLAELKKKKASETTASGSGTKEK